MFGLSLVSHSIGDIIKKANSLFFEFDEFIAANVYDDKIIRVYLYPPNSTHDRLGDLVIFQKGFFGLPKTMFIANNNQGAWHLVLFRYEKWCYYLLGKK